MRVQDLFNAKAAIAPPPAKGVVRPAGAPEEQPPGGGGAGAPEAPRSPVFITPQSLVSFPVASGVVLFLWQVAQNIMGEPAKERWVGLVIALFIAAIVALISLSDDRVTLTTRQKAIGAGVFIINWLYLYGSVVGIKAVIPTPSPASQSTTQTSTSTGSTTSTTTSPLTPSPAPTTTTGPAPMPTPTTSTPRSETSGTGTPPPPTPTTST